MQASAWPRRCKCGFPARLCGNGNEISFPRARLARCRAPVRCPGFLLYESARSGNQSRAAFNQARAVMQTKQRRLHPSNLAMLALAPLRSLAHPRTPSNHALNFAPMCSKILIQTLLRSMYNFKLQIIVQNTYPKQCDRTGSNDFVENRN